MISFKNKLTTFVAIGALGLLLWAPGAFAQRGGGGGGGGGRGGGFGGGGGFRGGGAVGGGFRGGAVGGGFAGRGFAGPGFAGRGFGYGFRGGFGYGGWGLGWGYPYLGFGWPYAGWGYPSCYYGYYSCAPYEGYYDYPGYGYAPNGYTGYGAGYGAGYGYGPYAHGDVKIDDANRLKNDSVYVDGGYLGPVNKTKKFTLSPGNHNVEVRDSSGASVYQQQVQVVPGRTIDLDARSGGTAAPPPAPAPPPSGKSS